MNTIKSYLTLALHYILFYVQDFDGLKTKLHLANDSYDSYYNSGDDVHYVQLKKLGGEWIVININDGWHHNPMITVMLDNGHFTRVRLSNIEA